MTIAKFLDFMRLALERLWLHYATLQNSIPSFPWIVPGWRKGSNFSIWQHWFIVLQHVGRRREVVPDDAGRQEVQGVLPVRGERQDPRGETGGVEQLAFTIREINPSEVRYRVSPLVRDLRLG